MTRRDLFLGVIAGLVIGFFAQYLSVKEDFGAWLRIGIIVAFTALVPIGLAVAWKLGKRFPIFWRFGKFIVVGVLNTLIDLGILNFISVTFNIFSGLWAAVFNVPAFGIALTNSYFWNRSWVFENRGNGGINEVRRFIEISLVGLAVNTGVFYVITTFVSPFDGISPQMWELIAKVPATALSMVWNFLGYKLIVFKVKEPMIA